MKDEQMIRTYAGQSRAA